MRQEQLQKLKQNLLSLEKTPMIHSHLLSQKMLSIGNNLEVCLPLKILKDSKWKESEIQYQVLLVIRSHQRKEAPLHIQLRKLP